MELILILIYLTLFSAVIYFTKIFRIDVVPRSYILGFFLMKVFAAFCYVYIFKYLIAGNDIFNYFAESEIIFSALKENPLYYLQLTFGVNDFHPEPPHLKPYIDAMGFWYDQGNYFMVRMNAIFRLFSFGFFKVHILFISFLSFIGLFNMYKFFRPYFNGDQPILIILLFFTPSVVFWYSGMHKEAFVILSLGLLLNHTKKMSEQPFVVQNMIVVIFSLVMLFLVRFYVFAAFIPGLMAFLISKRTKKIPPVIVFVALYGVLVVFGMSFNSTMMDEIVIRQEKFLTFEGKTSYDIPVLDGTVLNFFKNIPRGGLNVFTRPFVGNCLNSSFLCYMAMIEAYLILFVVFMCLIRTNLQTLFRNPMVNFCLFTSLSLLILIGVIVNNAGALVRYKSVALPFLLIGLYLATKPHEAER